MFFHRIHVTCFKSHSETFWSTATGYHCRKPHSVVLVAKLAKGGWRTRWVFSYAPSTSLLCLVSLPQVCTTASKYFWQKRRACAHTASPVLSLCLEWRAGHPGRAVVGCREWGQCVAARLWLMAGGTVAHGGPWVTNREGKVRAEEGARQGGTPRLASVHPLLLFFLISHSETSSRAGWCSFTATHRLRTKRKSGQLQGGGGAVCVDFSWKMAGALVRQYC